MRGLFKDYAFNDNVCINKKVYFSMINVLFKEKEYCSLPYFSKLQYQLSFLVVNISISSKLFKLGFTKGINKNVQEKEMNQMIKEWVIHSTQMS